MRLADVDIHVAVAAVVAVAFTTLATTLATTVSAQTSTGQSCERLTNLALAGARVTAAHTVAAGAFTPASPSGASPFADLPSFCRVTAEATRPNDSAVTLEVWLPAPGTWTGEFQPAASGFAGGTIGYQEMRSIVGRGLATANTNRGHDGGGPWKAADMGHAPYHLMIEHAKAIVSSYYRGGPTLTLMNECGGAGSRDALQVLQHWPADLDAVVAEGIVYRPTRHGVSQMWAYQASRDAGALATKLGVLHQGALQACDAKDGVTDGVISDPPRCGFDPAVLECRGGVDAPTCLTAAQVAAAKAIYGGPRDSRTQVPLYPPLVPGSELNWQPMVGPDPYPYASNFYRNVVFQDPAWSPAQRTVNFDSDVDRGDTWASSIDANDPHVAGFLSRGGKLLMIGGWNDNLPPGGNVEYYENVVKTVGPELANRGVRLFMVPGMHHCLGEKFPANATTDFDAVAPLKAWKAGGPAPEQIVVTQTEPGGAMTRRLVCAYPRIAQYSGQGSSSDPANFSCR